jgi:cellulose biosynthesis protein BcsQ
VNNRVKAKRLVIFNHKGGVGKTTLTVNLAYALAKKDKRILLVDSDPQCNLTSYLVAEDVVDDLLDNSDGANGQTVWSAVKPVVEGIGDLKIIQPIELANNNVFLLPGDIRLSEFESELTDYWSQCSLGKAKGFRGTTAFSRLVNQVSNDLNIDYVFYDSGPNIGPLNRIILLDCDFFIVPAACDLFSVRALKTLGNTLDNWIRTWERILALAPEDIYVLPGKPRFIGYIAEGFRVYGGRIAQQHSKFLSRISKEVHSQIVVVLKAIDKNLAQGKMNDFKLGEIKDYGTLVSASQKEGVPIEEVNAGTKQQREHALQSFKSIADKVIERINVLDES